MRATLPRLSPNFPFGSLNDSTTVKFNENAALKFLNALLYISKKSSYGTRKLSETTI